MAEKSNSELTKQFKEKILEEIAANHSYEALNYAQSFIARKRKHLGKMATSAILFFGVKLLVDNNAGSDAGTLLAWYIEDGAGDDFFFLLEDRGLNGDKDVYCDIQRTLDLLSPLAPEQSAHIVTKIYGPIHKAILNKKKIKKNGPLSKRLELLEIKCADIFEKTKDWLSAYKSVLRLEACDMNRAASILNLWCGDGYATEKPLFFARAILQLLADNKAIQANTFLIASNKYVYDNTNTDQFDKASIAVYNLATILSNLSLLPPKARVDPLRIFNTIAQLYLPILQKVDVKLIDLLEKVGVIIFGYKQEVQNAPNPMAILSNMMNGSGKGGAGGMDMSNIMAMMQNMQGRR